MRAPGAPRKAQAPAQVQAPAAGPGAGLAGAPKAKPGPGPKPGGSAKPLRPSGPGGPGQGPGAVPLVQIRPLADAAMMKPRHWGLVISFGLLVLAPLALAIFYLFAIAQDQYSSTTGFTVRQEEGGGASDFLGILPQFGGGGAGDSDVLYEFIQSQRIVEEIDARLGLREHYSQHWSTDKVFGIWPDATIEDLLWFWKRVVRISYDQPTGLIELRVLAFDPAFAQAVSSEIVAESQSMINALSDAAREDAMRYARGDLDEALTRLKEAREALQRFRTRTQIVDPEADIQGRMGVMNNLQQQLAQSLIDLDLLRDTTNANDPRVVQAQRQIQVIRSRIAQERENFATDTTENNALGQDYPSLIAEFESLVVDREFAEETYRAALTALDVARANANRQSRYLATYIEPTQAQSAEFPRRFVLIAMMALFLVLTWSILALVYYSIRDRR